MSVPLVPSPRDRRRVSAAAAASMMLMLAGCAVPPGTPVFGSGDTTVEARITAAVGLNADAHQRPSPLVLRIYELAGRNAFDTADFISLYERDKDTLAADLVARDELVLQPGETRDWARKLGAQTRFIAVVAAYRNVERAGWRSVVPVKAVAVNKLALQAGDLEVRLTPAPR